MYSTRRGGYLDLSNVTIHTRKLKKMKKILSRWSSAVRATTACDPRILCAAAAAAAMEIDGIGIDPGWKAGLRVYLIDRAEWAWRVASECARMVRMTRGPRACAGCPCTARYTFMRKLLCFPSKLFERSLVVMGTYPLQYIFNSILYLPRYSIELNIYVYLFINLLYSFHYKYVLQHSIFLKS